VNNLDKLITHFEQFPGVGARQARRFAFFVLSLPTKEVEELAHLLTEIQSDVVECESCRRFFARGDHGTQCSICVDGARDHSKLMVVERDVDIIPIERAGMYDGLYFVLGGTLPLLDSKEKQKLRGNGLKHIVEARIPKGLQEIILAFSVNPDGENTTRFVQSLLSEVVGIQAVTISELGRGLSTGSELEYADPETIKNALKNRH
jgi:recombination protein RecR